MIHGEHLQILKQGVPTWNKWRKGNVNLNSGLQRADFSGADLRKLDLRKADLRVADLRGADLRGVNLTGAGLNWADLSRANLTSATLHKASLRGVDFLGANLRKADLSEADLGRADLTKADLKQADLSQASLIGASIVDANLERANLNGCYVYGVSAWRVNLTGAQQSNLVISPVDEPLVTVDSLEVAQFVFLLLSNPKLRGVIDTIGKKGVLILGRFTPRRKAILDALRVELRKRGFLPIIFDFDAPSTRNLTETVSTLAHLSRFVIADITQAKSIPQELGRIVPMLPSVPVQPIMQARAREYSMFDDFYDYPSVLPIHRYNSQHHLLASLEEKVIAPAVLRANEVERKRQERQKQRKA